MKNIDLDSIRPEGLQFTALAIAGLALANMANHFATIELDLGSRDVLVAVAGILILILQLLIVWQYWQGRNWARIVVMITSVLFILALLGLGEERGFSFVSLGLSGLLSIYLVHFLNRQEVVAWFKGIALTSSLLKRELRGTFFSGLRHEKNWLFGFDKTSLVSVPNMWRLLVDGRIVASSLEESPDLLEETNTLLRAKVVRDVRINPYNSDLSILFEMGIELQAVAARGLAWEFTNDTLRLIAESDGSVQRFEEEE